MNLGLKIKALREGKGLTREQMIDYLPMSISTYKKIEYGEKIPTLDELKLISKVIEVDPIIFLQDDAASIVNHGNFTSGMGNIIINEKEIFFKLITSIQELSKSVGDFTLALKSKI